MPAFLRRYARMVRFWAVLAGISVALWYFYGSQLAFIGFWVFFSIGLNTYNINRQAANRNLHGDF